MLRNEAVVFLALFSWAGCISSCDCKVCPLDPNPAIGCASLFYLLPVAGAIRCDFGPRPVNVFFQAFHWFIFLFLVFFLRSWNLRNFKFLHF
jgi:hypothetical protein